MTLGEYVVMRQAEIMTFYIEWRVNHEKCPEDWPMSMDVADWAEQELMMLNREEDSV